jgi:hypothetical protein
VFIAEFSSRHPFSVTCRNHAHRNLVVKGASDSAVKFGRVFIQPFEEDDMLPTAASVISFVNGLEWQIYMSVLCNNGVKIVLRSGYYDNPSFTLLSKTLVLKKWSGPHSFVGHALGVIDFRKMIAKKDA